MAAAAARMPAKDIESRKGETSLHFDAESDLSWFLDSVLQKNWLDFPVIRQFTKRPKIF